MTKTREIIQSATSQLLDLLRSGNLTNAVTHNVIHRQNGTDQPSEHWSLGNQILMLAGSTDARGFRRR